MKKSIVISVAVLLAIAGAEVSGQGFFPPGSSANATSSNQINSSQTQAVQSEGGDAYSDSVAISGDSGAMANVSTNTVSNYETRTPPIAMFPPYLPTFSHGGWGIIDAYFPNGPTADDRMYERAFYPNSKYDIKELKSSLTSIPYEGPLSLVGGIFNCFGTIFGAPDNFHHGRGFEIANSVVRKRRPENRPLYILIDTDINRDYLDKTGYIYMGKISLEGKVERNWDQVYEAAIAEAIPWDIDIMLVSGGMKGVTIGTNLTFPGIAGAYSQANYSISMLGGNARGLTEGKGVAMVSAECYRYYPAAARRRAIPEAFYDRIHETEQAPEEWQPSRRMEEVPQMQNRQVPVPVPVPAPQARQSYPRAQRSYTGVNVSPELSEMAGFGGREQMDYAATR
ncbi:MAG: hypothetical protein P8016_08875 [Sedimentisphaerales bacterium]